MCWTTAAWDLPAARGPCGCGCSRAEPAAGGCRRSAALRGTTPGGTEGWARGSWKGGCGPGPSTSAAAGAGWPGGGPGLLLPPLRPTGKETSGLTFTLVLLVKTGSRTHPLLPAGAVGAGLGWQLGDWEDRRAAEAPPAGLGL